ncbi:hypothetical protein E5Z49_08850 [Listeria monocytogenes]|uniref:Uncharacterized protein n=1 Tax=Listeria monocytogenes TaxID=1639 RepID=A0AAN2XD64_LISMN|nr:hypothetical protein [Listeria monocytogenes]EAC7886110.1 hypothetical protein [Listeria monocytogenes]EAE0012520.1 hypothetical protein [Listeria monocytogenes]EAE1301977.1 hypothetical protein [Listeria monocytogenes]EAF8225990.1 hypothetical protein [Listeria monocytogenes]EAG3568369.1 hypothetical protein [Listeria monocytogenes]
MRFVLRFILIKYYCEDAHRFEWRTTKVTKRRCGKCVRNCKLFKENKANLILKYDSIRENNKYTFILFDTEKKDRIFGGDTDTDSIIETEQNFINNTETKLDFTEVNELFFKIKNAVKSNIDNVLIPTINYSDGSLKYSVYIDNEKDISHNVFLSYKEIKDFVGREIWKFKVTKIN